MSGYGASATLPGTSTSSSAVGALGLKAACEAARAGKADRKPVYGSWMMFNTTGLARIMANLGYKWILVDTEHGAIGDTEMHNIIPAIAGTGCVPIVRVPGPENFFVKRALDAGAHGIMFPMVETKEQAAAVVRMCKFPPAGMRGVGSPFAPAYFRQTPQDYQDSANESIMVIVQIETATGLKNAAEIAAVPGIDMLFIGPNDLSSSLGNGSKNHMDVPEVQEAIEGVRIAAESAGKLAGIWATTAEQAAARFKQGFQLINVGGDIVAVTSWMSASLAKAEELS